MSSDLDLQGIYRLFSVPFVRRHVVGSDETFESNRAHMEQSMPSKGIDGEGASDHKSDNVVANRHTPQHRPG